MQVGLHGLLAYTAGGYDAQHPTDSFTYTVADPHGATVTGTVDVTVTGTSQPTQVGTNGPDTLTANGAGQLVFAGGDGSITVNGAGSTIYGGPGANTVTIHGAKESIVLQQGGVDQINGFNLHNGDVLDLSQVLAESQVTLTGNLSSYFAVSTSGSDAALSFNPNRTGPGGSAVAVLHGVGAGTTFTTLINDHVLKTS